MKSIEQIPVRLSKPRKLTIQKTDTNITFIFRISQFIHRYKLYKTVGNYTSFFWCRAISIIVPPLFAIKEGAKKKLEHIWSLFYPKLYLNSRRITRWYHRLMSIMLEQIFDITLFAPAHTPSNVHKFISVEGWEHIESALQLGHGVLVPSIHIGQFYHIAVLLFNKTYTKSGISHQIEVSVLVSSEIEFLIREYPRSNPNLHLIISRNHQDMRILIEKALKKNHCVFLLYDYFKQDQLRVPFIYGSSKYKFLMPCPQTISYFHIVKNIPVVPALDLIDRDFCHSTVKFFPAVNISTIFRSELDKILQSEFERYYQNQLTKKQQYGLYSTIMNRIFYPFTLQYPFLWQEIYVCLYRSSHKISFGNDSSLLNWSIKIHQGLSDLLEHSYEPGRRDAEISEVLRSFSNTISVNKKEFQEILTPPIFRRKYIELGRLTFQDAVKKIEYIFKKYISSSYLNQINYEWKTAIEGYFSKLSLILQKHYQ